MASTYEAYLLAQINYLQNNTPVLLTTSTLGSNQASAVLSVPSGTTYNFLEVRWRTRSTVAAAAEQFFVQLNGDTGSNYLIEQTQINNAATTSVGPGGATTTKIQMGTIPGASATALYFSSGNFQIGGASDATNYKTMCGTMLAMMTVSNAYIGTYGGQWNSAAVVTSVTLTANSGNLLAGSVFSMYGYN